MNIKRCIKHTIGRRVSYYTIIVTIALLLLICLISVYVFFPSSLDLNYGTSEVVAYDYTLINNGVKEMSRGKPNSDIATKLNINDKTLRYRNDRYKKYKQSESSRHGPGEHGGSVTLTAEEQKRADELYKKEAFNIVASDKISLERSVSDSREGACRSVTYPADLPTASVIIIFHNEAWSPLLRTAHSVVNRSPPRYLYEVLLVNDYSDRPELGSELETYVNQTWPDGVVKIVKTVERSGLIRTRLAGAEAAAGDVLVFLDSHCEVNTGWLEPLLARIKEKPSAVLCPEIDHISAKSLAYQGTGSGSVGTFWWSLHFNWKSIPRKERERRKSSIDPIRSPTMAGGLLAASRSYFFHIGAYDPGMDVWGGENLEISFRVWMCGGSLEFIPCSRVGHIFRDWHPYTFPGKKDTHGINSMRLAEVWMDEYKRLFYSHRRDLLTQDYGDISARQALRQRLKCHSFKWYLDNISPDKFIIDEDVHAWGMVRNPKTSICLDIVNKDEKTTFPLSVFACQGGASANQVFSWSMRDEIRREVGCLDVSGGGQNDDKVFLRRCYPDLRAMSQVWTHDKIKNTITHQESGKCLTLVDEKNMADVYIKPCDGSEKQKWVFEHYLE